MHAILKFKSLSFCVEVDFVVEFPDELGFVLV